MKTFRNETARAWAIVAALLILPAMAAWGDDDDGYDDSSSYSELSRDDDDSGGQEDYGAVAVPTYRGGYGYSGSYATPAPPVMVIKPRPGLRTFGGITFTGDRNGTVCFSGTAGTACY